MIQRPSFSPFLQRAVARFQDAGAKVFGDFDDLVFDSESSSERPAVLSGRQSIEDAKHRAQGHKDAIALLDGLIVSTPTLLDSANAIGCDLAKAVCIPNLIHWSWMERWPKASDAVAFAKERELLSRRNAQVRVGYFSGTRTHDGDLELAVGGVVNAMHKHPKMDFALTGKVQCPTALLSPAFEQRVALVRKVRFSDYGGALAGVPIQIAPLQLTRFNRCKSGNKVMEAAFFGCQSLVSSIPSYEFCPEETRILVPQERGWYEPLQAVIESYLTGDGVESRLSRAHAIRDALGSTKLLGLIEQL